LGTSVEKKSTKPAIFVGTKSKATKLDKDKAVFSDYGSLGQEIFLDNVGF
jgi:hypothetical protein